MTELPVAFLDRLGALEGSYLRETDPVRQSGFGGGPERWRTERALALDAVSDDRDFLDVGCANGYLLECLVTWGQEQHIRLTPYGVDCGAQLIALAKQRLPGMCHPEVWHMPGSGVPLVSSATSIASMIASLWNYCLSTSVVC
jgi:hypothetical protein